MAAGQESLGKILQEYYDAERGLDTEMIMCLETVGSLVLGELHVLPRGTGHSLLTMLNARCGVDMLYS